MRIFWAPVNFDLLTFVSFLYFFHFPSLFKRFVTCTRAAFRFHDSCVSSPTLPGADFRFGIATGSRLWSLLLVPAWLAAVYRSLSPQTRCFSLPLPGGQSASLSHPCPWGGLCRGHCPQWSVGGSWWGQAQVTAVPGTEKAGLTQTRAARTCGDWSCLVRKKQEKADRFLVISKRAWGKTPKANTVGIRLSTGRCDHL